MILLALECSSPRRSVAIWADGAVRAEAFHTGSGCPPLPRMLDDALRRAGFQAPDLDTLAVGLGPGSYAGIRSAIAAAQGLELARPLRVLGTGSLNACALRCQRNGTRGPLAVALDALRGEVYLAEFELTDEGILPRGGVRLEPRAALDTCLQAGKLIASPGLERLGIPGIQVEPDAAALAELAAGRTDFVTAAQLEPIYLRPTSFVKAPTRTAPGSA